jgi:hypothetical protein
MSPADKEKTILGWYNSKLSPIRTGIRGISHTLRFCWLRSCPEYYHAVGYQTPESPKPAAEGEGDEQVVQARRDLLDRAEMGEFQGESLKTLRTQTLVIGSGSGGSSFVNSFANRLSSQPDLIKGGQTWTRGPPTSPTPRVNPSGRPKRKAWTGCTNTAGSSPAKRAPSRSSPDRPGAEAVG